MMHAAPIVKLTGAEVQIGEGSAEIVLPVKKEFFHTGEVHCMVPYIF